jgi:hypothetical protein
MRIFCWREIPDLLRFAMLLDGRGGFNISWQRNSLKSRSMGDFIAGLLVIVGRRTAADG